MEDFAYGFGLTIAFIGGYVGLILGVVSLFGQLTG